MSDRSRLFIIGDIHGHLDKLTRHLLCNGLAANGRWTGGDAELWFMGDFTDRGSDGTGAIELVMQLQADAEAKGGKVGVVLGNHDVALLTAYLFPNAPTHGPKGKFYADWLEYGGIPSDVTLLKARHVEWLKNLPAMARVRDRLLIHADALFYANYGATVQAVNAATTQLLHSSHTEKWDELLGFASQRLAFDERKSGGAVRAAGFLAQYGGKQIIHGHSPIPLLSGEAIDRVTHAYVYSKGQAVDVDGGMYKGGTGFVYEVPPLENAVRAEQLRADR